MHPGVAEFVRAFLEGGKPIGCVSLGEIPVRTVLGEDIEVPAPAAGPQALTLDRRRSIVHTPGFTAFTRLADVKTGIDAMVTEVLRIVREARSDRSSAARGNEGTS